MIILRHILKRPNRLFGLTEKSRYVVRPVPYLSTAKDSERLYMTTFVVLASCSLGFAFG